MSRSARTLVVAKHCPAELKPRPPPQPPATDPKAPPPPPRNGGWCLHDFALHKQLGVGATSVVFKGAHSRTGLCVALKIYFKAQMSALNRHQVQRETEIHSRLDHPNIITMVRLHPPRGPSRAAAPPPPTFTRIQSPPVARPPPPCCNTGLAAAGAAWSTAAPSSPPSPPPYGTLPLYQVSPDC